MTVQNQSGEPHPNNNQAHGLAGLASRVRCDGFTCLAFLDAQGQWRNYYTKELLPSVLEVLPEEG